MTEADEMYYARNGTLEGLLQRGRGLGAVRAREDPAAAAPFVYDGIRRDWRWDNLVDERAVYLAQLVRELAMPTAPVVDQLSGSEDECSRAADVLVLLAPAGSDEARDGLRAYICGGEHWVMVLELVADRWPDAWWEDLADVARTRIGQEPEPPWRAEPWTRFGIAVQRPASRPVRPDLTGHTDGQLLDLLMKALPGDRIRGDALRELCRREPVEGLIPLVPSLVTPSGRLPVVGLTRAVEHLGALAVPEARRWAHAEPEWLARIGRDVLADQLVPEALPGLVAELSELRRTRTWCGPAATARRLARFGPAAARAAGDLRRLWLHTPHSYERAAYLEALAAIDPSGLDYAYSESLWDCQEQAQLLGIAHAQDNPSTLAHIAALRDDPMVPADIRIAAAARHHRGLGS
ncbi:hypothetical protein [Streptomyces mesophilus]|uniref:hypothetical protein n=1 Tax=Streptomyces mesophilus TaxID=1775132 RepID=UPI003320D55D